MINLFSLKLKNDTYYNRKAFFGYFLLLCSVCLLVFSALSTNAIVNNLLSMFGNSGVIAIVITVIWEVLKAITAHEFFADLFLPPTDSVSDGKPSRKHGDPITWILFFAVWAGGMATIIYGIETRTQETKTDILTQKDSSTTANLLVKPAEQTTKEPANRDERKAKEADATTAKAQAASNENIVKLRLAELEVEERRKKAAGENLEKNAENNTPFFLGFELLTLLCICGHTYIASHAPKDTAGTVTTQPTEPAEKIQNINPIIGQAAPPSNKAKIGFFNDNDTGEESEKKP